MRQGFVKVVLMVLALAVAPASLAWAAAPKIIATPELHDFGMVETGNKINVLFTIVNAGDAELAISDLKADCGCTAVVSGTRSVPPGGRTEVEAVFDSSGHIGKISRTISVLTNDPQQPRKDLVIQGVLLEKIGGELVVTPHSLNTGKMAPGGLVNYTYELRNSGVADLSITEIATSEGVAVKITFPFVVNPNESRGLRFVLKPGEVVAMNATIAPRIPEGRFQEQITISSNSVLRPVQRMVIRGTVAKK